MLVASRWLAKRIHEALRRAARGATFLRTGTRRLSRACAVLEFERALEKCGSIFVRARQLRGVTGRLAIARGAGLVPGFPKVVSQLHRTCRGIGPALQRRSDAGMQRPRLG